MNLPLEIWLAVAFYLERREFFILIQTCRYLRGLADETYLVCYIREALKAKNSKNFLENPTENLPWDGLGRIFDSPGHLPPLAQSPSYIFDGSDAEKNFFQCEDDRKITSHLPSYSLKHNSLPYLPYSRCDCIKASDLSAIRVLNHSHSILTIYDECEHGSFIGAFKYDDKDWKLCWTWKGSRQEHGNHIIRNNANWLFHIYVDRFPGTRLQAKNIEHGYQSLWSFKFELCDIHLDNNSACGFFDNVFYFINRKIRTEAKTGQKKVDYNGFITAHSVEPDESDYYDQFSRRLEFKQAFLIHDKVIFSELSLRKDPDKDSPTIVDMICQEHAGDTNQVSWICFSQIIEHSLFSDKLAIAPSAAPLSLHDLSSAGVTLYSGPKHMEHSLRWDLESPPRPSGGVYGMEDMQCRVILQALRPRYKMPQFGKERSIFGFLRNPCSDDGASIKAKLNQAV